MYYCRSLSLCKPTYTLMDGWNCLIYTLNLKNVNRGKRKLSSHIWFFTKFNCNMLEWMFQLVWPTFCKYVFFFIFKYKQLCSFYLKILCLGFPTSNICFKNIWFFIIHCTIIFYMYIMLPFNNNMAYVPKWEQLLLVLLTD